MIFRAEACRSEELGQLDKEGRTYQVDSNLGEQAKGFNDNTARIDIDWWSTIIAMKSWRDEIPYLGKVGEGSSLTVHWPSC